jgi:hypothetical protein
VLASFPRAVDGARRTRRTTTRDVHGMLTEAVVCAGEVPANQPPLCSPPEDLRLVRPVIQVAGITGYERLAAGIPGEVSSGMHG